MAVALPTPATDTQSSAAPLPLWVASLAGGVYILAALAVVFYGVPELFRNSVSPLIGLPGVEYALRYGASILAAILLVMFGLSLLGPHPAKGLRGGIFLALVLVFAGCFLARGLALMLAGWFKFDPTSNGSLFIFGVGIVALGWLALRFMRGARFPSWSESLEHAGWFQSGGYKKNQGVRVRQLTTLGLLLLFGTGIYTLMIHQLVTAPRDWTISLPFIPAPFQSLTLLPLVRYSAPLILGGLALWVAYRAVNVPAFADFLIATEAEINKVSWTPRAQLIKDTIVVLIVTFIITMFLFVVDIFWGWILSRELVGVLPSDEAQQKSRQVEVGNMDY